MCAYTLLRLQGWARALPPRPGPRGASMPGKKRCQRVLTMQYSNFVMLRSTLGRPAPPVTLGGAYKKNMIVSQILGGTKTLKNKSQTA